jgi:hypothetical protein
MGGTGGDDAHAHNAVVEHYSCVTYIDPLQVTDVLCCAWVIMVAVIVTLTVVPISKMCDHLCLISFPYSAGEWTDVLVTECSVNSSCSVCPFLATYRGSPVVTSALDRVERPVSRLGLFTPGKEPPSTHWIRGWLVSVCCVYAEYIVQCPDFVLSISSARIVLADLIL